MEKRCPLGFRYYPNKSRANSVDPYQTPQIMFCTVWHSFSSISILDTSTGNALERSFVIVIVRLQLAVDPFALFYHRIWLIWQRTPMKTDHIFLVCGFLASDRHWAFWFVLSITKTCLYKFDPLKPHFYIVKLGFIGVYIIFLSSAQNIYCGYSLEPPRRGGSNEYPQSMFWAEIWKNIIVFYLKIFSFWRLNFLYIWIGVFS